VTKRSRKNIELSVEFIGWCLAAILLGGIATGCFPDLPPIDEIDTADQPHDTSVSADTLDQPDTTEAPDCRDIDDMCNEGTWVPGLGRCAPTPRPDGTPCDDGDGCTQDDACLAGTCLGVAVSCPDPGPCEAGVACDPATGRCVVEALSDGTPCDDGRACTTDDVCAGGACAGQPLVCEDPGVPCASVACAEVSAGCVADFAACGCERDEDCGSQAHCVDFECECLPSCDGKECGPDACGGTCGTCTEGLACNTAGACVCEPDCVGKQCGGNGCGGLCGLCGDGLTCSSSAQCVLICGGVQCPSLSGYLATCNARAHCEYTRIGQTEPWYPDDGWIYLPPGSFPMGAPEEESGSSASERPVHTVTFQYGFLIQKLPATARLYEACEVAGSCTEPSVAEWDGTGKGVNRTSNGRGTHPQNGLSWDQANDVCSWLGGALPSEAEWEYAAKGPSDHRVYPWGDEPPPTCDNETAVFHPGGPVPDTWGCGAGGTAPVDSTPAGASAAGAMSMAGNVWEWVEDCVHSNYVGAPSDGSAWTTGCAGSGVNRTIRGGAFTADATRMRTAARGHYPPATYVAHVGARCRRAVP